MSPSQKTFGEKLKALRRNSGKSQFDVVDEMERLFGKQIRISQATISTLEQRSSAPRQQVLEILAQYYQVPITYFFEVEDEKEEKLDLAKKYLDSLKNRLPRTGEIRLHTNDNSSNDTNVTNSLDNLLHWQPEYDSDEYLED